MPFESSAQNRWAHTPAGTKALGGQAKVKEWERATDYSHLPERVMNKGHLSKTESYAKGGAVLGRTKNFLKQSDGADQNVVKRKGGYKNPTLEEQDYGKADNTKHKDDVPTRRTGNKSLKAIIPRK